MKVLNFLPGQSEVQSDFCSASPEHVLPPFKGAGFVHNRERCCPPRPHLALHSDQGLQVDQPPLTVKKICCEKLKTNMRMLPYCNKQAIFLFLNE